MSDNKTEYIDITTGKVYESADSAFQEHNKLKAENADKKNPPFIQLNKETSPSVLASIARKSGPAVEVLMFFFQHMDNTNVVSVSQKTIAETLAISPRTVTRAIKILEEYGTIGIGKVNNSNVYLINPRIAWQKAYKDRYKAVMKGRIILGKSENEALFKKFDQLMDNPEYSEIKDGFEHKDLDISLKEGVDTVPARLIKTKKSEKPSTEKPPEEIDINDYHGYDYTDSEISYNEEPPFGFYNN